MGPFTRVLRWRPSLLRLTSVGTACEGPLFSEALNVATVSYTANARRTGDTSRRSKTHTYSASHTKESFVVDVPLLFLGRKIWRNYCVKGALHIIRDGVSRCI